MKAAFNERSLEEPGSSYEPNEAFITKQPKSGLNIYFLVPLEGSKVIATLHNIGRENERYSQCLRAQGKRLVSLLQLLLVSLNTRQISICMVQRWQSATLAREHVVICCVDNERDAFS